MWIQGDRSDDPRASSGLRIYGSAATRFTNGGELVSVSGRVAEYRSSPNDLLLTEIDYITSITYKSSGHTVKPLVLGIDRIPPKEQSRSTRDAVPAAAPATATEGDGAAPPATGGDSMQTD